jgi:hypothetical protein
MKIKATFLTLLASALAAWGGEGAVPKGVPDLDHVFFIMMENHGYSQIAGNPNAPFINQLAKSSGYATNYFAVGHPSSTNYLEVVGGSNFGVRSDDYPDWHNKSCTPNLVSGITQLEVTIPSVVCPIWGSGTDAATPALDCTNEVTAPPCLFDIDGVKSIAAAPNTIGKTIADQLAERRRSWKSYQESLPPGGADLVNYSDGVFTNNTDFTPFITSTPSTFSSWTVQGVTVPAIGSQKDANGDIVYLYAAKHNPFVYFRSVQEGTNPGSSLANVAGFDGPRGLYQDLGAGTVPNFSFIAPNQCNDQHGRGNAGPFCNFDENDNGTQTGLNQALILQGDVAVQRIVTAIKSSEVWHDGKNAIVVVWDENDYTATPNQVLLIVDTNYGDSGVKSAQPYNHFSLLKTLEAAFDLPCLNHACDNGVNVMTDLFAK